MKGSPPSKVVLKASSIASPLIEATCTCAASKKGQFCKHLWTALLAVQKKHNDFLIDKLELSIKSVDQRKSEKRKPSESQKVYQEVAKKKQADYRKQQYQNQKQRLKASKKSKKNSHPDEVYPKPVEVALDYFTENGFPLKDSLTADSVRLVKKKLSRIFHPDVGGSHQEIIELNKHVEILMSYIDTKSFG